MEDLSAPAVAFLFDYSLYYYLLIYNILRETLSISLLVN